MTATFEIEAFRYVKAARRLLKPATQTLEKIAADDDSSDTLRLESLLALGQIGDPESLSVLMRAFDHFYDYVEPITALGHFKNSSPVSKLIERLQDPDALYKDEIVRVLGEIGDPMATKSLMDLLHDEDRMVRYYSARALFKMGGRDVVQALCSLLNDPDEWIVINVLEILSKMQDTEAVPALVGQFETSRDARLKAIIISSLSTFAEGRLLKTFESALESFDPRIQANAVEAISMLKIPALEMKRKLKKFYGHPNNRVRANVCLALAKADPKSVSEELDAMITSSDAPTRRSAAYVLSLIDNPKREEYIHKLLGDTNPGVRKMALKAALSLTNAVGLREILPLLNDESEWVRREAVECATLVNDFPDEKIIELLDKENSSPVIEVILKYIVKRSLINTSEKILNRIKLEKEEEIEWLIAALGHLGARECLVKAKKFLGPARAAVFSEYYRALLLNGELPVFEEIAQGLADKKREQEKTVFVRIAGEVGAFVQNVDAYSTVLLKAFEKEVKADLAGVANFDAPALSPEELMGKGREYYLNEDYARARDVFNELFAIQPENADAGYFLGSTLYNLGDLTGAENALAKVFEQNPERINSGILLGQVYFRNKDWANLAKCYQILKKYLKSDDKKNIIKVFGALGLAYYNQKKYPEAIAALNVGLKANARDLSSTYHLALCHFAIGETEKARTILEGLRKTLPPDSQVLKNVLELLQRM